MKRKSITIRLTYALAALMTLAVGALTAVAQSENNATVTPIDAERIINKCTTKEAEFRKALNQYSFKRDAVLQSIGMGGQITGEYHRVSSFTFDDSGNRYEKIWIFSMPSMSEVTQEDIDDLGGIEPSL
jgi:hypothetical protein